jgi:beta-1,4-mannosyltransferase
MSFCNLLQVVDMFGCGLPVCALAYSCISELVSDGQTGLLFTSAEELASHLATLLRGFNSEVCGPLVSIKGRKVMP